MGTGGIRLLKGPISKINCRYGTPYSFAGTTFVIGDPPQLVTIGGESMSLSEGEYMAVAVKRGMFSDRGDVVLAYQVLGEKGVARRSGWAWLSFMAIPSVFAIYLCLRVFHGRPGDTEALIWLVVSMVFTLLTAYRWHLITLATKRLEAQGWSIDSCSSV
jgi:hypothetical protein